MGRHWHRLHCEVLQAILRPAPRSLWGRDDVARHRGDINIEEQGVGHAGAPTSWRSSCEAKGLQGRGKPRSLAARLNAASPECILRVSRLLIATPTPLSGSGQKRPVGCSLFDVAECLNWWGDIGTDCIARCCKLSCVLLHGLYGGETTSPDTEELSPRCRVSTLLRRSVS